MNISDKYEAVIGLEVHAQLMTKSKIFASDDTTFGRPPNTQVSTITLALPGTLPKTNKEVVEMAVKMGIACNCNIAPYTIFSRKNYFYADLPKGYQISQDKFPICEGGFVDIKVGELKKSISLTRIHLEEDAGKNNHELDEQFSMIDLNRAGVPLIEIVSDPVISNSDEAYAYITEIRKLVRFLDVCDGNMEEGSMRCDANISIRLKGEKILNTRVEVKNMNSVRNVKRAIDGEIKRQIELVEKGEKVIQQTRSFDPSDGSTFPLRSKESAHDYRYFPEPDLPPISISAEIIEAIKLKMPPLPNVLFNQFVNEYGLSEYAAGVLTDEKETASYFLELTKNNTNYKAAANWILGEIKSYLNESGIQMKNFMVSPASIIELIKLVDGNIINLSGAKKIFIELTKGEKGTAISIAEQLNLIQNADQDQLSQWVNIVLEKNPEKVKEYKNGRKGILGLFMGDVMKLSQGKADPKLTTKLLQQLLDN
ncbi:MAG: Asp-tRNA(Asn)/Glu-tRNA(Gln) amidotransferase subunit GatB [Bacteroidetes bacterium]|nr:Asp-tRNA(Asn)/Glu-tRNA(Gln) amidotransferase subunit GatB [Bacteroidota bacterium]MBK9353294.1 Asp-tRNA(Asn)/Glu-tRNA(Gln) amidotransferase subunit GatB [Bacteroidota bacterium]